FLDDINGIDFAGLSTELKGLLTDVRGQLSAADVGALVAAWTRTAGNIDGVLGSPEMTHTLAQMNAASKNLNQLLAKLDAQAGATTEQLNATLAQTRETMAAFTQTADILRKFVGAQQNLGADATAALTKLGRAADAVAELADFLERNPNALITGRKGAERPALPPCTSPCFFCAVFVSRRSSRCSPVCRSSRGPAVRCCPSPRAIRPATTCWAGPDRRRSRRTSPGADWWSVCT